MLGIVGIFASLALLIFLAHRGWNVIFVAPICATVAILFVRSAVDGYRSVDPERCRAAKNPPLGPPASPPTM